jgi:hypothetical protein
VLTKADDYPVHQTADPIAYAGTDRNFYDRYFFNGYTWDGGTFFAAAFGVYPHLNVMDAAFCVVHEGVQHNLHASKVMHMERLDTVAGPVRVDVLEPLKTLAVRVAPNEHGISAALTFHARAAAIEEPRFIRRNGPRTMMDYTRLTQNGDWEGWIDLAGTRIEVGRSAFVGTRDRSWGVRPVGAADSQPVAPAPKPQFYWLWSPLNFPDAITLYHINADEEGEPWNTHGVFCATGDALPQDMDSVASEVAFRSGTRHARSAQLRFHSKAGETVIDLEPRWQFYMAGLGYGNPEWGHGAFKGELAVGYEAYPTASVDEANFPNIHVQAFVKARMSGALGEREGAGVLEQLIMGPHAPSGFTGLLDPAP